MIQMIKETCARSFGRGREGQQIRAAWWLPSLILSSLVGLASTQMEPYLAHAASSWLICGLLGLSLALVWGQMGFLSLGQTAFYGLGGYLGSAAAINAAASIGNTMLVSVPVGAAAGAGTAGLIGLIVFYGRMGPLQGTILTYTLTLLIWTVSVSFNADLGGAHIGGDNGMSDIPGFTTWSFGPQSRALEPHEMFVLVLVFCTAGYLVSRVIMRSSFGKIIACIRQNPEKTNLLGYDIRRYQLTLFAFAGGLAGIAGALYGAWGNYVSPSLFSAQEAMLVPIYVLVGGIGSLGAAFVGAVAVGALSFWLGGGAAGGQATLVLGLCLMALVVSFRTGLVGTLAGVIHRWQKTRSTLPAFSARVQVNAAELRRLLIGATPGHETVLVATELLKRFGGVVPVDRVSRTFVTGAVHCLIGPNGAGKSSLLRCCTGVYPLDSGSLRLDGQDITRWPACRRVRAGVGIKTQAPLVFLDLTAAENVWVAAYRHTGDSAAATLRAETMLNVLGLAATSQRKAGELAHGAQQWLDIAMVLSQSPRVLFLDEPAAGMTAEERRELTTVLLALSERMAVIVVEHDMAFVQSLGGPVTVLHQGEVFADGDIESLRRDDRVLDIYLGRRRHVRAH